MMMIVDVDEFLLCKREQCEQGGRWIASGAGDQPRRRNGLPVVFGQTIGGLLAAALARDARHRTTRHKPLRRSAGKSADMSMTLTLGGSCAMISCAVAWGRPQNIPSRFA